LAIFTQFFTKFGVRQTLGLVCLPFLSTVIETSNDSPTIGLWIGLPISWTVENTQRGSYFLQMSPLPVHGSLLPPYLFTTLSPFFGLPQEKGKKCFLKKKFNETKHVYFQ
jgi:hypothetical protein